MPNVSTYVRTEDLSKYLDIAKEKGAWTEFIHNALADGSFDNSVVVKETKNAKVQEPLVEDGDDLTDLVKHKTPVIKTKEDATKVIKEVFPEAITYKNTQN